MSSKIYTLILSCFILNFLQAIFTPITEDEAYYWVWSQNLDWGYFDHPPMIAWWISLGYEISQNELGVRLLTVLLNSIGLLFLAKILQPKNLQQVYLFGILCLSTLVVQVFGFLSTPDAPLLFFCFLYLFALKKFIEKNSIINSILLGISFAGLMYSKYHGVLLIIFSLLPILKILWKNPKFYLAVILSLILYFPHLNWMYEHDFVQIKYHFIERSSDAKFEIEKIFIYLGIFIFGTSPLLAYFNIQSIIKFKPKTAYEKSIWFLAILPGIFFFLSIFKDNVQPQWLLISFIAISILTYWNFKEKENLKTFIRFGIAGIILVLILRILIILPNISPLYKTTEFAEKLSTFQIENAVFEKYQETSIYSFYNPDKKVAVHRTLGNRKNQFTLWDWEENFEGKTVQYISPWVKSDISFVGGHKNYTFYIKNIPEYKSYEGIEIETSKEISAFPNQNVTLKIKIKNLAHHPIEIGGDSELQLNISYYTNKQYEVEYSTFIQTEKFSLNPSTEKEIKIQFKNAENVGTFNACIGLNYNQIGTTYKSNIIKINSK